MGGGLDQVKEVPYREFNIEDSFSGDSLRTLSCLNKTWLSHPYDLEFAVDLQLGRQLAASDTVIPMMSGHFRGSLTPSDSDKKPQRSPLRRAIPREIGV